MRPSALSARAMSLDHGQCALKAAESRHGETCTQRRDSLRAQADRKRRMVPSVEQERDRTVFCELENPHQPVAVWSSPLHIDHLPECVHGEKNISSDSGMIAAMDLSLCVDMIL